MRQSSRPQPAIWIRREDYDAFKRLSPNDPDFPDTYDEWFKDATEQIAKSESRGLVVDRIVVDPQQFAAFCKAGGIETNYAIRHRSQPQKKWLNNTANRGAHTAHQQ